MINIDEFLETLIDNDVTFFAGVPDSNLNDFCKLLKEKMPENRHVIAANEGNAIAVAAGFYFGNDCVPMVYMQNSGMGNAFNPLVSLCDSNVYSVPMVLLIGWRGDPSTVDHAQHRTQGRLTPILLDDMGIPYRIIDENNAIDAAKWAAQAAKDISSPVALIAKKGVLAVREKMPITDNSYHLCREEAMNIVLDAADERTVFSATTGRASRELYELRNLRGESHARDFLNVGSMGHASSVALGIALARPERQVICFDGDAAVIMHMGSMAVEGQTGCGNYLHIVLNNGVHESVGGQPSAGRFVDFTGIASGCGFETVDYEVKDADTVSRAVEQLQASERPGFIDVHIHAGLRPDMPVLKCDHHKIIDELKSELRKRGDNNE